MSVAVVLAGGSGTRLRHHEPKQFIELAGRTILEHAVAAFEMADQIDQIIVVSIAEHLERVTTLLVDSPKVAAVVAGGVTRTESTARAVAALIDHSDDTKILIHDAARPLVSQRIIAECLSALDSADAVATVVEVTDTIYEVEGDQLIGSPDRSTLRRAQTPQGFRIGLLRRAVQHLTRPDRMTDDIGAVLHYDPKVAVAVVAGDDLNLKITSAADLELVRTLVQRND